MSVLDIQNVSKIYGSGNAVVKALDGVSLKINEGAFMTISGPSGSGKSTLLNIIGFLVKPDAGQICFHGQNVSISDFDDLADFRRVKLGFIFQSFNLVPVLSARENIMVPLILEKSMTAQARIQRADELLAAVGLSDKADQRPDQLSGGQKQRVSVARALALKPSIILADEPTANLDSDSSETILSIMRKMNEHLGTAFVFSTHDPRIVKYAKQKVVLRDGKISETEGV